MMVNDKEEEVKVYRPKLKDTTPIILPKEEIDYSPKLTKLSTGGKIKMRVNAEAMLDTVSDGLYASPKSGVRELLFNEVRACKIARKEFGASPKIEIRINPNPEVRSFEIIGIDSMGFSIAEYETSFCETGASTNFDEEETGQYGLGRLSYVKMSPLIRYDVWARRTNELYAFTMQDAKEMYPVDKPETLESFGCRIKLTLKEGVDVEELIPYIENISRFAEVPINLVMLDNLKDRHDDVRKSAGTFKVGSWTKEEYFAKLKSERDINTETTISIPIHIDSKYFTYDAIAIYQNNGCFKGREQIGTNEITLINVPIDSKVVLPEFSASVLNLKIERANDEVNIKPATNRESLTDETDEYLTKTLREELIKYFRAFDINSIDDYFSKPMCHVLSDTTIIKYAKDDDLTDGDEEGYYQYRDEDSVINQRNALSRKTRAFIKFMNTEGVTMQKGAKPTKTRLSNVMRSRDTFYLPKLNATWEDRLKSIHKDVTVFTIHKDTYQETREIFEKGMIKYGIQNGKEYAKANKIKAMNKTRSSGDGDIAYHFSGTYGDWASHYRKETDRIFADDLDEDFIMVDKGSLRDFTRLQSELSSSYKLMKFVKNTEECEVEAITLTKYLEDTTNLNVSACTLKSVDGSTPTIAEIVAEAKELHKPITAYEVVSGKIPPNIDSSLSYNNRINVVGSPDEMFALGCHCIDNGVDFLTADVYQLDKLLQKATTFELNDTVDYLHAYSFHRGDTFAPNQIASAMRGIICFSKITDPILKEIFRYEFRSPYELDHMESWSDTIKLVESKTTNIGESYPDRLKAYQLTISQIENTMKEKPIDDRTDSEKLTISSLHGLKRMVESNIDSAYTHLTGLTKIESIIKYTIQPMTDIPITATYTEEVIPNGYNNDTKPNYILKFKNTNLEKPMVIGKDIIETTIDKLNEYRLELNGVKAINNKDSVELHLSIGERQDED